uniref:PDZ domain-containing protein n=1 Tax=Macrostomum lignano TaxID=282301 RepID=A0A1I8ISW0_9PLAT
PAHQHRGGPHPERRRQQRRRFATSASCAAATTAAHGQPAGRQPRPAGLRLHIRAIRVYQGDSNFFLLHHLVVHPRPVRGLRSGDLVTHVNEVAVTGLPHPEVIALILRDPRLQLRATPLSSTPIRADGRPRGKQHGRMVRRPQIQQHLQQQHQRA